MQIKDRQQFLIIVTISVAALFVADKVLLSPLLNAWDARHAVGNAEKESLRVSEWYRSTFPWAVELNALQELTGILQSNT